MNIISQRLYRLLILLLSLTLFSIFLLCNIYAAYVTSADAEDGAAAAAYVFRVNRDKSGTQSWSVEIASLQMPGDSVTLPLYITNTNGNKICGVAQQYQLSVKMQGSVPAVCQVKKEENTLLELGAPTVSASGSVEGKTEPMPLPAGVTATDACAVVLSWPATENNYKYSEGERILHLCVTVQSKQLD